MNSRIFNIYHINLINEKNECDYNCICTRTHLIGSKYPSYILNILQKLCECSARIRWRKIFWKPQASLYFVVSMCVCVLLLIIIYIKYIVHTRVCGEVTSTHTYLSPISTSACIKATTKIYTKKVYYSKTIKFILLLFLSCYLCTRIPVYIEHNQYLIYFLKICFQYFMNYVKRKNLPGTTVVWFAG